MRKKIIWLVVAAAAALPAFGFPINLGTASTFGLLGGTISNTGTSVITGDVGAMTTITGFLPTGTATGTVYLTTGGPQVTAAYNSIFNPSQAFDVAMGLPSAQSCTGGNLLTADCTFTGNNVYTFGALNPDISTTTGINLTFDAQNDASEYFIIRIAHDFTENGVMTFTLENQARADHIFWIVGHDATISIGSSPSINFDGSIIAGDTFTMSAGSGVFTGTINGCVFARNANTLAAATDVGGCSNYNNTSGLDSGTPEPGSLGLASLGCLGGILAWRKRRVRP